MIPQPSFQHVSRHHGVHFERMKVRRGRFALHRDEPPQPFLTMPRHRTESRPKPDATRSRAMVKKRLFIGRATISALVIACVVVASTRPRAASGTWITAWGTSQQGLGMTAVSNATVRMIARVTIPGEAVRIRLDNTFGTAPLRIGAAYVGERIQAAAIAKGSNRRVTFKGEPGVTIAPGATAVSDQVALKVAAWQDLAISLFVPEANLHPSQHAAAVTTSYLSADGSGDVAADETRMPFARTT